MAHDGHVHADAGEKLSGKKHKDKKHKQRSAEAEDKEKLLRKEAKRFLKQSGLSPCTLSLGQQISGVPQLGACSWCTAPLVYCGRVELQIHDRPCALPELLHGLQS